MEAFVQFFVDIWAWLNADVLRLVVVAGFLVFFITTLSLIIVTAKLSRKLKKQARAFKEHTAVAVESVEDQPVIDDVTVEPVSAPIVETPVVVEETPVVETKPAPAVEPVVEVKPVASVRPVTVVKTVKQDVAVTKVEKKPEPEIKIADIDDASDDLDVAKRVPFKDKILASEQKVQDYYNELENTFRSYRKINPRVSIKCLSIRLGRDLVAKLTIRGRTLKLHLALDVKDFDENVYFQKDMSDVREYVEVPFAVKVRSDRALKNAIKLIDALAQKHGIERKSRYTDVDCIALLKEMD